MECNLTGDLMSNFSENQKITLVENYVKYTFTLTELLQLTKSNLTFCTDMFVESDIQQIHIRI